MQFNRKQQIVWAKGISSREFPHHFPSLGFATKSSVKLAPAAQNLELGLCPMSKQRIIWCHFFIFGRGQSHQCPSVAKKLTETCLPLSLTDWRPWRLSICCRDGVFHLHAAILIQKLVLRRISRQTSTSLAEAGAWASVGQFYKAAINWTHTRRVVE